MFRIVNQHQVMKREPLYVLKTERCSGKTLVIQEFELLTLQGEVLEK